MTEALHEEALRTLEGTFGSRIQVASEREPALAGAAASVEPVNAHEVRTLAQVAYRYSVSLVPLGAGTVADPDIAKGSILVRFDLMRRLKIPEGEEPWAEAEPGTPWLELEDELRVRGRGLAVYPTSAPRATVGGWLATDGFGVGSFEYGRLSENVLSASVVLPDGELREAKGEDLQAYMGPAGDTAIVVNARLRTRSVGSDTPFAVAFEDPDALARTVTEIVENAVPLWHLAFINPTLSRARRLGDHYLLFGAYPAERSALVQESLRRVSDDHAGRTLDTAETHRVWTERFFPVAPAHPTPDADRAFVPLDRLPAALAEHRPPTTALQGTVARSGETLLLTFELDA